MKPGAEQEELPRQRCRLAEDTAGILVTTTTENTETARISASAAR